MEIVERDCLLNMAEKRDEPERVLERLRPKLILAFEFNLGDLADLMHSEGFPQIVIMQLLLQKNRPTTTM